jgi:hypothetical protein
MSRRTASWLAWSVCTVSLLLMAFSLLLIVLGWSTPLPQGWAPWWVQVGFVAELVGAPILGGLIASRRPENPYGWVWLGFGLGLALFFFVQLYAAYALVVEPGSLPAPHTVSTVLSMGWVASVIVLPFLFLLFPDGLPPSRRWRFVAWAVAGTGALVLVLAPLHPDLPGLPFENPFGVGGPVGDVIVVVTEAGLYVIFAAIVLSALSLVVRYRRAGGVERRQIKWFALAAVVFSIPILLDIIGVQGRLPNVWSHLLENATFAFLYVAVGVAILRYRLYDIDVIINRTLVYGSLTALLAALYFGGIAVLQRVFVGLTGQKSTLAVVASTLVIAALFNPLRRRIQTFIDRRFYRSKYDARKTLEAFSTKLRNETDLDTLSDDLVGVVRETMQPAHVSLWLRPDTPPKGEQPD